MILVGIPALNESKNIGKVVRGCLPYVDKVLVIDDGSRDDTAKVAFEAGATVISHPQNMGMGASENTILCFATDCMKDGDILITLDGDGQHFPEDIPKAVAKLNEGFDVVSGSRLVHKGVPGIQPYRRVLNGAATYVTRVFSGYRLTDSQSGFKAYRFWVVRRMKLESDDMAWCSESFIRLGAMRARLAEIPIRTVWTPPSWGRRRPGLWNGIRVFKRLLWIWLKSAS